LLDALNDTVQKVAVNLGRRCGSRTHEIPQVAPEDVADIDAMVVCDWGGWNNLKTFLGHYRGTHAPEGQRRKRQKVKWL